METVEWGDGLGSGLEELEGLGCEDLDLDLGVVVEVSRTREPGFLVLLAGMVDDDDGGLGEEYACAQMFSSLAKSKTVIQD